MAKVKDEDKAPGEFPEKWYKIIKSMPEFKDTADSASEDDLKKIIVSCEGNIYTVEQEKAADAKLNATKELMKDYSAPYSEGIRAQTARIKYALFLLENKGVDMDNRDD